MGHGRPVHQPARGGGGGRRLGDPPREREGCRGADVTGAQRLLAAAEAAGVRHVVVISIIGCDTIPLPFYASKMRIEALVRGSRAPWTIVRVAQFHPFVERLVATPAMLPIPAPIIADLRFQPVDEGEAARAPRRGRAWRAPRRRAGGGGARGADAPGDRRDLVGRIRAPDDVASDPA
ncbi:MAG: NAD(P)H-binding protein [Chloroflexota bacterium]